MCDPHHTRGGDAKRMFSCLASKPMVRVCQWFSLKTTAMISCFIPQNQGRRFGDLGLKIIVIDSWFGPQNQGRRFGDLGLKTKVDGLVIWASKSPRLVWAIKPSGRRFVGLHLKTDEWMKMV
jgi:hypothetical protein